MSVGVVVLVLYIGVMFWHAIQGSKHTHDAAEYHVAGRALSGTVIGLSFYASFMSTNSFVGLAGMSAVWGLGLWGIGAMFVRSMTVALVRGGHLSEFRFLEPGAFYAIVALSVIMLISIRVHVPEVVTGLIGAVIIGLSLYASIRPKQRFPNEYEEAGEADALLPSGDVQE